MAKKVRKKARKVKRTAKPRKGAVKAQKKKVVRRKARRRKTQKEGPIAGALHAVTDTLKETAALRSRLAGHETFED